MWSTGAGEIQVRPLNKEPGPGLLRTGVDALSTPNSHALPLPKFAFVPVLEFGNLEIHSFS